MKVEQKGTNLIITIPMKDEPKMTPGGNMLVASSGGNKETELKVKGKTVIVGVNAYYKP